MTFPQRSYATVPQGWMKESTEEQMQKLHPLLADSPLKHIKTETV